MAFWWVNHNQTYIVEIDNDFIWSPKTKRNGNRSQTYVNLTLANPGDVVFSYANTKISAIGIVAEKYKECARPPEYLKIGKSWAKVGWKVPVIWKELENPILPKDHISEIRPHLPSKYSPLQKDGTGVQTFYLMSISDEFGDLINKLVSETNSINLEIIKEIQDEVEEDAEEEQIKARIIGETEKDQLIKARRGQGIFKQNVENIEHKCRLTHITDKRFLIASHIKPWKDSTDQEKLDGDNGLLISPHVDKLFDRGWISFYNSGDILCIDNKIKEVMKRWGLDPDMNVGSFSDKQRKYLEYHRNIIHSKRKKPE